VTRLLQAMAGAKHGGAEAFFERLATSLRRAGEEQKLAIRRDPERAARLRRGGLDVAELGFGGMLDLLTSRRLARIIAEFRPRVVLTWMSRATALCPRGDFVHVARLGGYYDLRHYRDCDHLIGNTRALAAWLVGQGWPKERVHYLPNFAESRDAPPVPRAALGTPEGVPLALALGRLHPNKGFDVLLDAVAQTKTLHLWLAGDGPLDSELKRQVHALRLAERVRFLGWRNDVGALLAASDMLVCPSRVEPLGNTVLEAWAARVPVIATRCSGPAELIDDGRNGVLVPVGDAAALASAVEGLAADPARAASLVGAGHETFLANFSENRVVASYREFLARVER